MYVDLKLGEETQRVKVPSGKGEAPPAGSECCGGLG